MVALMFAAVLFNINVSADTYSSVNGGINSGGGGSGGQRTTYGNGVELFIEAVIDFSNGNITYDQYTSRSAEIIGDYMAEYSDRAGLGFMAEINEKISETVAKYALDAPMYVSDWISDIISDYEETTTTSTTDKKGYTTMIKATYITTPQIYQMFYWNGYIEVEPMEDGTTDYHCRWKGCERYSYSSSFGAVSEYTSFPDHDSAFSTDMYTISVYGDVRYLDGSEAPTDDEFETGTIIKFDDLSDSELEEILEDINEELERQNPDLSNIEGLLQAIYYQVCGINDKMITYDQCNALILSLISSNDENAQDIINALFEIRDDLKNEDDTTSDDNTENDNDDTTSDDETTGEDETGEHPKHIYGTLYNVKPLDKNWLNKLFSDKTELKVEYQGSNYYLESCGCLLLGDKHYSVDMNYDNYMSIDYDFSNENITIDNSKYVDVDFKNYNVMWANLSTSQKNKINNVVELIYKMVEQAVPYSMVTTTLQAFQVVVFNTATPEDVVLSIDETTVNGVTIGGFEVTVLSTEFFSNGKVAEAMKIVKAFLTVVIGYAWLLSMRKKVVGMLG